VVTHHAAVKDLVGQVPTLADRTGVGDPIVEELQMANPGSKASCSPPHRSRS
jgi:hypothetical protein